MSLLGKKCNFRSSPYSYTASRLSSREERSESFGKLRKIVGCTFYVYKYTSSHFSANVTYLTALGRPKMDLKNTRYHVIATCKNYLSCFKFFILVNTMQVRVIDYEFVLFFLIKSKTQNGTLHCDLVGRSLWLLTAVLLLAEQPTRHGRGEKNKFLLLFSAC